MTRQCECVMYKIYVCTPKVNVTGQSKILLLEQNLPVLGPSITLPLAKNLFTTIHCTIVYFFLFDVVMQYLNKLQLSVNLDFLVSRWS